MTKLLLVGHFGSTQNPNLTYGKKPKHVVLLDEIAIEACGKNPIISGWGQITYCPFIHQQTVKNRDWLTEKTQQNSLDSLGIILITFYL